MQTAAIYVRDPLPGPGSIISTKETRRRPVPLTTPPTSQEAAMTAGERPLCDCPEPCGCYAEGYAAGKDKLFFEIIASLEEAPHAEGCACQPCQIKRACLQKLMTLMASSSPETFELVETWVLQDPDNRH